MARGTTDPKLLFESLSGGDRRSLAKAITFAESRRSDHQKIARAVIEESLPAKTVVPRIGISGTPGVGKSTFIEAIGLHLLELGHRPAVISVDPSSTVTGGSILGDKTRMPQLAASPDAYIRPSASAGVLGGVAAATDDVVLLCEAAGYGPILLETVGTGQSETAVESLTDLFVLLVAPGGGDDLQGIKRGVMELVDILVVNKADGPRVEEAQSTVSAYRAALSLMRPKTHDFPPVVVSCSAMEHTGIAEAWDTIQQRWTQLADDGVLGPRRVDQRLRIIRERSRESLLATIAPSLDTMTEHYADDIRDGSRAPSAVAAEIVEAVLRDRPPDDA